MRLLFKLTTLILLCFTTNITYADDLKRFEGDWVGETSKYGEKRKVEVVLWSVAPNKLKGVTYYPDQDCAGRLRFEKIKNGKLIFSEVIFTHSPDCLSGASIVASLTTNKELEWIWHDSHRGILSPKTASANAKQFALAERTGKPAPKSASSQYSKNKPANTSANQSTPVVKTTVKNKTKITSPEGLYLVSAKSLQKIKTLRYEKKQNKYVIDIHIVDAIDPLFKVGERYSHAAWYLSSQQLHITDIAVIPDLQRCNYWTKLYWTYTYEQVQPNIWKEVNKYGKGRTPSTYCKDIQIEPDTCKWWCERSPPPPKPDSYLVKGLAEAKSLYKKIAKPKIVRRNMQENNARSSPQSDPWKKYWDQKVQDSRQNVIDNW